MRRLNRRKKLNAISIFLVFDLLVLFAMFNISHASYTSEAIGDAEMEVALYAFRFDGMYEGNKQITDLNLGNMKPGDTKSFKFKVYNTDLNNTVSDTDIIYGLKIITTTNIHLNYELYYATDKDTNYAQDSEIMTDAWGTNYNVLLVPDRCFKYGTEKYDEYILKVTFPESFNSIVYQDLIESIKVQLVSKQAFPDDIRDLDLVCR